MPVHPAQPPQGGFRNPAGDLGNKRPHQAGARFRKEPPEGQGLLARLSGQGAPHSSSSPGRPMPNPALTTRLHDFLPSVRVGVDFGESAGGIAVVKGNQILHAETYVDFHETTLEKRRQMRRRRKLSPRKLLTQWSPSGTLFAELAAILRKQCVPQNVKERPWCKPPARNSEQRMLLRLGHAVGATTTATGIANGGQAECKVPRGLPRGFSF